MSSVDNSVDEDHSRALTASVSSSVSNPSQVGAGVSASEYSREDILKQIFGDVGDLIVDLSCAVESTVLLHGRMYITNRHLCFYSNIFGLEKKIRIPYSHITAITKEMTALVIPNALSVTTYRKEYLFRSFWDRDECYRLLKDIVTKYKSGGVTAVVDVGYHNGKRGSVLNSNLERQRTNTSSSIDSTIQTKPKSTTVDSITTNIPNLSHSDLHDQEEEEESGLHDSKNDFTDETQKARLKISVISGDVNISLKEFAKLFIEENATYSYGKYHEEVNDTNVIVSPWAEMSSSLGKGRDIKFLKPVNLPALKSTRGVKVQRYRKFGDLGLIVYSSTRYLLTRLFTYSLTHLLTYSLTRLLTYSLTHLLTYSLTHLLTYSHLRLEDVPAADTFSVEDVLIVKSIGEDKINIDITFEVKFIKSTMFKYVIESNTNSEMTKWLEAFYHRLVKCSLTGLHTTEKVHRISTTAKVVVKTKAPINFLIDFFDSILERSGIAGSTTFWAAWLLLFITFSFFSYQWLNVNRRISNMHHEIAVTNNLLNTVIETQNYIRSLAITDVNDAASMTSIPKHADTLGAKLVTLTTEIAKMAEKISALEKIISSK